MDRTQRRQSILAISQVYPPDPTSLGQHMHDAASELAHRGHHVVVLTADRGYSDPSIRYVSREELNGVDVRRIGRSSFGKRSMFSRLAGSVLFLLQTIWLGIREPVVDTVLVSTSPPMAGMAGALVAWLRRARLVYWVMDLNPDQAVAMGVFAAGSLPVRMFDALNRIVLRRADEIVVTDRFMAQRLRTRHGITRPLHVIPPWPHADAAPPPARETNPFRQQHHLAGKFVVMYSGNHSPANPLRTVIDAAVAMQSDPRIAFVFIGGGERKHEVEAAGSTNILSLPYQPIDTLPNSLSAADLHIVTMGENMVGIAHTCKVYGAFAAARPVLFVGPAECHVSDLMNQTSAGWRVAHGDVDGVVAAVHSAMAGEEEVALMGARARAMILDHLSQQSLCSAFADITDGSASEVSYLGFDRAPGSVRQ